MCNTYMHLFYNRSLMFNELMGSYYVYAQHMYSAFVEHYV